MEKTAACGDRVESAASGLSSRRALWVLVPIAALALGLFALAGRFCGRAEFASCRNHSSFVVGALNEYISKHGWLPSEAGVKGEELFCRLDFRGIGQNCHRGAPGQDHGGWQMVNASRKSWARILQELRAKTIPVVWCGRSHSPGRSVNYGDGEVRIVIVIDQTSGSAENNRAAGEAFATLAGQKPVVARTVFDQGRIIYGMPDSELGTLLNEINAILREAGEQEIPIDVRGHSDYGSMAKPHQTVFADPKK